MGYHTETKQRMLRQAGVPPEVNGFLSGISVPLLYEWAFFLTAAGMPEDRVRTVCALAEKEPGRASRYFREAGEEFLKSRYGDPEGLRKAFHKLQEETGTISGRITGIEDSLSGLLQKALREKELMYAEKLEEKEEASRLKDGIIREKEKQITILEEKARELEERIRDREESPAPPAPGLPVPSPEGDRPGSGKKRRALFRKKDRTAEDFIRLYMKDPDLSPGQKEYLVRCLEEGDSLEEISVFAHRELSVELMELMRKILRKRQQQAGLRERR